MKIDYFRKRLNLPDWAQYVATDRDGVITAFEQEPELAYRGGYWASVGYSDFQEIGNMDMQFRSASFWENSLVYYEKVLESSKISQAVKDLVNSNKFPFEHVIKICCYKNRTDNVDAQRDLLKHIRDISGGLNRLSNIAKSEPLLRKRGANYIKTLLTTDTEQACGANFFRSVVKEYTKLKGWELTDKINEIRPLVSDIYEKISEYLVENKQITVPVFRTILRETKTFEPHELNSIFRNYKDID